MHLFAGEGGCPVGSALGDADWISGPEPGGRCKEVGSQNKAEYAAT